MDEAGLIGADNGLPWRLPNDLRHFKRITWGKPILMGRRTFQSIARPLPGRHNIILTRDSAFQAEGCTVVHTLDEALAACAPEPELMVIGGAEVYRLLLSRTDVIYLTRVCGRFRGDTYFPPLEPADWDEACGEWQAVDARNAHAHRFCTLTRRR